jgi:hypothetical protein
LKIATSVEISFSLHHGNLLRLTSEDVILIPNNLDILWKVRIILDRSHILLDHVDEITSAARTNQHFFPTNSIIQSNSPSKTPHIHPINLLRSLPAQIRINLQMLPHTLIRMIQQPAIRMMHDRHSANGILAVRHDTRQRANATEHVFCDATTGITENA